jgi:very-short-patch-repair endonuclease
MTNLMSDRARRMRREKGPAERKLWYSLREFNRQGFQFRQQAPIGPYIADFCDHTAKLVVEVDGSQHGEPVGMAYDRLRTHWLESQGYKVLRFWNNEVLTNIGGVEIAIMLALGLLTDDGAGEAKNALTTASPLAGLRKKARRLVRRAGRIVPSPHVGEGQGGGDGRTSAVGAPPTPNPSPQGGGEFARVVAQPAE